MAASSQPVNLIMKRTQKPVFFIILALILAFTAATFLGVSTQHGDVKKTYIKSAEDIRWGIDIRGGVDVTFSPPEGHAASPEEMAAAKSIIEVRLINQNIADYEIYVDSNKNRVIVRFPWKEDETEFDPEQAIKELGETAMLTFREGAERDELGQPAGVTADNIILEGKDVKKAEVVLTGQDSVAGLPAGSPIVRLELNDSGKQKFADATERLAGRGSISIWMDDNMFSSPNVQDKISDGVATITGQFSSEEANDLADKINAGALPFKLVTENYSTISPSLGMGAKDAMVIAGAIAFILVCIFMLVMYKVPGLVACIVLTGQASLLIASVTGFFGSVPSFTLTLPGIAGIILSIGFGVDANVISGERIKEEIQNGKTVDGAIEAGFDRAFSAIFDGNATVVLVSAVLMGAFGPPGSIFNKIFNPIFFMFGPSSAGNIYSFGYTLLMGVIFNMIMGVYVSRWLLKSLSRFKAFRKPWMYGGDKKSHEFKIDFNKNARKYFTISGAIVAVIVVLTAVMGIQLDIQFRGGAMITYSYDGALDHDRFESVLEQELGEDVGIQQSTDIATGMETVVVSLPGTRSLSSDELVDLTDTLQTQFPENSPKTVEIINVEPTIGKEFLAKSMLALGVALLLMMLYVAFRFRKIGGLSAGAMGVVALLHDCIVVFGVFILFKIPINDNFIAVILTILGFSLNDTVVVYDRVRENQRLYGNSKPIGELVSLSINQSLTRSVNTSLAALTSMVVVTILAAIYSVESIFTFSFPLILGLISGSYSTLCLVGPLWIKWKEYKERKAKA